MICYSSCRTLTQGHKNSHRMAGTVEKCFLKVALQLAKKVRWLWGVKKRLAQVELTEFFLLQENLSVHLLALFPWRLVEVESIVLLSNTVNKNDL